MVIRLALGPFGSDAVSSYATVAQLYIYGAPEKSFGQLSTEQKEGAITAASDVVDTYFRGRYQLPLVTWDISVTENTCRIAAYNLLSIRGYNPASGADVNILSRYEQAIEWLNKVQRQQAHPNVTPSFADSPTYHQPMVISSSVVNLATGSTARNRGW